MVKLNTNLIICNRFMKDLIHCAKIKDPMDFFYYWYN